MDRYVTLEGLISGCGRSECCHHIANISDSSYDSLIRELICERTSRKQRDISEVLHRVKGDWTETLHITLFRFLGGNHNRTATERLATIVNSHIIMRENSSLAKVEALLFGAAGLLDIYNDDEYISLLKQEFTHLATKYDITPMSHEEWQFDGMYHNNHPTLRIAQIAACLHENKISIHSITSCSTRRDVYNLFSSRASEYWIEQVLISNHSNNIAPRIGTFKSDILGINFVVPMMHAYGSYIESKELVSRAMTLLKDIPMEDNRYTRLWSSHLNRPLTAIDGQAFIQLSTVYCASRRCKECPLAKILTTAY